MWPHTPATMKMIVTSPQDPPEPMAVAATVVATPIMAAELVPVEAKVEGPLAFPGSVQARIATDCPH